MADVSWRGSLCVRQLQPPLQLGLQDPIFGGQIFDPRQQLLVHRGNVTGVTNLLSELGSKRLGLLRELVPRATVIATLINPDYPDAESQSRDAEAAARALGLQFIIVRASTERDMETAFATMAPQGAGALLVGPDTFFAEQRDRIVALAARHAIPTLYWRREFAQAGGLMSYGSDL